ncbi:hypothetical protein OO184_12950 [Photorhabdus sp. APURE]|uniref:hypothetical protein n=1 Tax=Photorhabdus aballayi TaxID=2991723 RepID=UPI00223D61A2|nr:hypothetical protein [Photorhabdus aballayi]MCW7548815.1 hypothetical protein [Photorhabdus aballayi]
MVEIKTTLEDYQFISVIKLERITPSEGKWALRHLISIPVIFQVASLLAALTHPGHIVLYAPGDSLPCRRDAS